MSTFDAGRTNASGPLHRLPYEGPSSICNSLSQVLVIATRSMSTFDAGRTNAGGLLHRLLYEGPSSICNSLSQALVIATKSMSTLASAVVY